MDSKQESKSQSNEVEKKSDKINENNDKNESEKMSNFDLY